MQIRSGDLAGRLAKCLSPVYVVHGDEPLLVVEAADAVREAARRAGCDQREVMVADADFDWGQLLAASRNLSLFGGRKLIDLRIPSGRPGAAGSAALQRLAAEPAGDDVVLITLPRADRATQAGAWFSALDRAGLVVAPVAPSRSELPRWIASRLAAQQQKASPETLAFLADRTEGNLLAAQQEIVKLGLLLPAGPIAHQAAVKAIADVARFDVADLSEAWLSGDAARVARILESLHAGGEAVQLILWQLGEDLHALWTVAEALAASTAPAQAVRGVRAWGRRLELLPAAARRLPLATVERMMVSLARLDALSKGIGRHSVTQLLEDVALTLAGRPVLPLDAEWSPGR